MPGLDRIRHQSCWLILYRGILDYGIFGCNTVDPEATNQEALAIQQQIADEALAGAIRISALVSSLTCKVILKQCALSPKTDRKSTCGLYQAGVLAKNGYLRLDPNFLHYSIVEAATFLARLGRPETEPCLMALNQFGEVFEQSYHQADQLEAIYLHAKYALEQEARRTPVRPSDVSNDSYPGLLVC